MLAPTRDVRARIPFLPEVSGGSLTVIFLAAFWAVAAVGLLVLGRAGRRSLGAALIPSFAYTSLLISGAPARVAPQFDSPVRAALTLASCIGLSLAVLAYWLRARRVATRGPRSAERTGPASS